MLADCETPFTDFRVEDCDGLPRAVFDGLPPEQNSLLSHFLYPDQAYIRELYLEILRISDGQVPLMSYEDDSLKVTITFQNVVIETKDSIMMPREYVQMNIPAGDVKLLLLKWKFQLMLREAAERSL
jgi:hypothetical protein